MSDSKNIGKEIAELLKKEINKQEKWIQKLEFKNRLLGVSKEIKN